MSPQPRRSGRRRQQRQLVRRRAAVSDARSGGGRRRRGSRRAGCRSVAVEHEERRLEGVQPVEEDRGRAHSARWTTRHAARAAASSLLTSAAAAAARRRRGAPGGRRAAAANRVLLAVCYRFFRRQLRAVRPALGLQYYDAASARDPARQAIGRLRRQVDFDAESLVDPGGHGLKTRKSDAEVMEGSAQRLRAPRQSWSPAGRCSALSFFSSRALNLNFKLAPIHSLESMNSGPARVGSSDGRIEREGAAQGVAQDGPALPAPPLWPRTTFFAKHNARYTAEITSLSTRHSTSSSFANASGGSARRRPRCRRLAQAGLVAHLRQRVVLAARAAAATCGGDGAGVGVERGCSTQLLLHHSPRCASPSVKSRCSCARSARHFLPAASHSAARSLAAASSTSVSKARASIAHVGLAQLLLQPRLCRAHALLSRAPALRSRSASETSVSPRSSFEATGERSGAAGSGRSAASGLVLRPETAMAMTEWACERTAFLGVTCTSEFEHNDGDVCRHLLRSGRARRCRHRAHARGRRALDTSTRLVNRTRRTARARHAANPAATILHRGEPSLATRSSRRADAAIIRRRRRGSRRAAARLRPRHRCPRRRHLRLSGVAARRHRASHAACRAQGARHPRHAGVPARVTGAARFAAPPAAAAPAAVAPPRPPPPPPPEAPRDSRLRRRRSAAT